MADAVTEIKIPATLDIPALLGISLPEVKDPKGGYKEAIEAHKSAVGEVAKEVAKLSEHTELVTVRTELEAMAVFDKDKGWILDAGKTKPDGNAFAEADLTAAKEKVSKAQEALKEAFKKLPEENPALKAFREAEGKLAKFKNPIWGKVNALGVGGAIADNLHIGNKDIRAGRLGIMGARYAGLGAALFAGYKGAIEAKTPDGEPKEMSERLAWLAGAVGIAGFAMLAGAAR